MKRIAVYPGTFDPVTNGHLDLTERASRHFDEVVMAVLLNENKQPTFSTEERVAFMREAVKAWPNVRVDSFGGLLVDYARKIGASVIVRGIRAVSDFEYELQMAMMNRRLIEEIETVFMVPSESYSYLSSKLVREVARFGGNISGLVPEAVEQALVERFRSS